MTKEIDLSPEEIDEKAQNWVKNNIVSIILGFVVGLGGILGFNSYQDGKVSSAKEAANEYALVTQMFTQSELSDISGKVQKLKNEYNHTPYAAKAMLLLAKQLWLNKPEQSIEAYQWVIEHAQEVGVKHAAKIRLAKIYVSQGKLEKAKQIATMEAIPYFSSYYDEILGDIAVKESKWASAKQYYERAVNDDQGNVREYKAVLEMKILSLPKVVDKTSKENTDTSKSDS